MSTMTTFGDSPWIGAASLGDGSALKQALEPYRDYLTLIAQRAIGPELAPKLGASDVVQETFLAAQQHVETFRGRTELEWRGWLKAILLHHLANQRRHHAAAKRRGPDNGPPRHPRADHDTHTVTPPSRILMRRERDEALAAAVDRLPEHYRQVVRWHHHDRLGFGEIAMRLGISADAAQKIWGRALVRLKDMLGPGHGTR